jgi:ferrochelatase
MSEAESGSGSSPTPAPDTATNGTPASATPASAAPAEAAPASAVAPQVSLDGVGVLLLHRGDPPSADGARAWLQSWYADPYAFRSSFGRGTQGFFASVASRFDVGPWKERLAGAGGSSPLPTQAAQLADLLGKKLNVPARFAALYTTPRVADAVKELKDSGVRRVVGVSLYPQKCERFSQPLSRALEEADADATFVDRYAASKGYVEALRASLTESLERAAGATVVFCALPIDRVDDERGDPYADQLRATTSAVMEGMAEPWRVAWMGEGAPGLPVQRVLEQLREKGTEAVVLAPLGCAVDELLSVHMLDVVMRQKARSMGFTRVERARPVAGYATFVDALASEVKAHLMRLAQLGFG